MTNWPRGIFVVGTDTGVGKTHAAAAIARTWMQAGRRVGVVKPVSTGAAEVGGRLRSADVAALIAAITADGSPFPPPPAERVGPLVYAPPLAPPVAARRAGGKLLADAVVRLTEAAIEWWAAVGQAELMVVEGVGGLLCPLAEGGYTVADLAVHLDYPLVIVAHRGLGTLNHTLLVAEAARSRGLRVAGIILNATRPPDDPLAEATNAAELATLLPGTAILADWGFDPQATHVPVAPEAGNWADLARLPRRPAGPPAAQPPGQAPPPPAAANSVLLDSGDELLSTPAAVGFVGTLSSSSSASGDAIATPPRQVGSTGSHHDLAGLDLGSIAGPRRGPDGAGSRPAAAAGPSWRNVVLASYASAVTLGLGWTLYRHRADRRPSALPVVPQAEVFTRTGRLGDRSRRVAVLDPIPADRMIPIGQSRQVGDLLIEPIAVERKNLVLERVNLAGKVERRDGGKRAVVLRLRLQNRSTDRVFAPVDPAFVRGRSDDVYETLLELDDGRKVYPDPLAVDSEWAVVGASFADLRPGETREVAFATEPNAPPEIERAPGTWRIKLRVGAGVDPGPGRDATAAVGIRLPGVNP